MSLNWNLSRELSKINYRIHTDAIKENLIPKDIFQTLKGIVYANEADVLNVALFGVTARQWRIKNPDVKGNIRDEASFYQLIILVNIESMNAELIKLGLTQDERALRLNKMAIEQMTSLLKTEQKKLM